MVMYVLVAWAVLNGQVFADSALYKSKENCEASKAQFFQTIKENPKVTQADAVCINVMEKRI